MVMRTDDEESVQQQREKQRIKKDVDYVNDRIRQEVLDFMDVTVLIRSLNQIGSPGGKSRNGRSPRRKSSWLSSKRKRKKR